MIQHNSESTTQCTLHKLFILLQLLVLRSVSVHFTSRNNYTFSFTFTELLTIVLILLLIQ